MSTATPFKALGAGNGFSFCRSKALSETERPTSILTLEESMAWWWLLKGINLEINTSYQGSKYTLTEEGIFSEEPFDPSSQFRLQPKDRLLIEPHLSREDHLEEYSVSDFIANGNLFETSGDTGYTFPQYGGDSYDYTPTHSDDSHSPLGLTRHLDMQWFDDGSLGIMIIISDGYTFGLALSNYPLSKIPTEASQADIGLGSSPSSIGTVDTPYGSLTAYSVKNANINEKGSDITSFTCSFDFWTFN